MSEKISRIYGVIFIGNLRILAQASTPALPPGGGRGHAPKANPLTNRLMFAPD
jgi:hypothetical protein